GFSGALPASFFLVVGAFFGNFTFPSLVSPTEASFSSGFGFSSSLGDLLAELVGAAVFVGDLLPGFEGAEDLVGTDKSALFFDETLGALAGALLTLSVSSEPEAEIFSPGSRISF
ncbi:MAG: hypothetical protein AABZ60_09180, partial [Planctomycetota bacterium]